MTTKRRYRQTSALAALLLCAPLSIAACRPTGAAPNGASSGGTQAGSKAPAARPVRVAHAWRAFLAYWDALSPAERKGPRSARTAEAKYLAADPLVREYFHARGGGDESVSLGDWTALPGTALDSVRAALADPRTQAALEAGAEDLARRLARVGSSRDSVVIVFLVGDYSSPFTTFTIGGTLVVAMQLESFLPRPARLSPADRERLDQAVQWRPDSLATPADVMPWAAYASARQFTPELAERIANESTSLAEFVLFHGFASRFARALYPESGFGRGVGPVRAASARALEPVWLAIGKSWHPLGTKPYLAARSEPVMTSKLPPVVDLDAAVAYVGARLAEEWLKGTRVGRQADEAAEISRLGRVPTLYAWDLIAP